MNRRDFLERMLYVSVATAPAMAQTPGDSDRALERYRQLQAAALRRRQLDYTERYVDIASLRLRAHVVTVGGEQPLLMIHGGGGIGAHWLPLVTRLPDKRLIVPDRPGCGLTDGFLYDGVDMRRHAVDFVAGVMDALELETASIIGNSLGGYYALCFALAHPNRVQKLVLAGGPAGSAGCRPASPEAIEARASPQPGRAGLSRVMADPSRLSDDLVELFDSAAAIQRGRESWRSILRSMCPDFSTLALHPELEGLSTPTLFIWGEQDQVDPPQPTAIAIAQRLSKARLVLLPDAGHLPWLDKPEECGKLVSDFLVEA